jgi:uncharacterized protein (TIGR02646 family)
MRRRDIHQVNPSSAWRQKAQDAADAVGKGKKKPGDFSEIWRELKHELAQLSHNKCWYCECRQARADNAVDHFRPKSKYPWRAFSIENFRFSCTFCNSIRMNSESGETEGKGDSFPLLEDIHRAKSEADIAGEQPLLLDPCIAADCGLLDFRADGTPCPVQPEQPIISKRVRKSIKTYHLDAPELNEQRRVLALQLEDWIKKANSLYPRTLSGGDPVSDQAFQGFAETIARSFDDRAELSAFARRMVKIHRAKPWIEQLLDI